MEALTRMAQRESGDLISRAAAGDEFALRTIMAEHHEDMRRVAAYVVGDSAIADEAAQAAWAVAWKKLDSVRDPSRLRPWLVSVAVNEAKQLMRKDRRRSQVEAAIDPSGEPGDVDPATGVALLDLRAALDRLDPDDRALLAMRYIAGFDSNELAVALGISPTGTRSRLRRLLDRLRRDLTDG
jgi:RNA polymerase sigma-70 factor (ECF subfamily)